MNFEQMTPSQHNSWKSIMVLVNILEEGTLVKTPLLIFEWKNIKNFFQIHVCTLDLHKALLSIRLNGKEVACFYDQV